MTGNTEDTYGEVQSAMRDFVRGIPAEMRSAGMVCARCDEDTDNNTQGHYWGFCSKTRRAGKFHFCCPTMECEYEESSP